MNLPTKTGLNYGLASGVLTTIGLMIGLATSTESKSAVIGGVLTIAIADALSDAFGIHVAQESQARFTEKEVWQSTFSAFVFKFLIASTFLIPFFIIDFIRATLISIAWGYFLILLGSYLIAKEQHKSVSRTIVEHTLCMAGIVIATFIVGESVKLLVA